MFKNLGTTDLTVIEGHLTSQEYMGEVLRPVVLLFYAKTSGSTRPRMTYQNTPHENQQKQCCAH